MLGFGLGLNKWRRVGGGYVGLLDLFPNAAAAYSLRLLRKDYSGGLVRARAWDGSANQGEADVMAYRVSATEYVLDLNSTLENLDATAISRGLTTSDTLADLVSTGVNDYDGLTSAWYDQSLSNDATQSTAANQPKIVSAGSLVTENGKAAIEFDGVDDLLQKDIIPDIAQPLTLFHVRRYRSNGVLCAIGYATTPNTGYADINVSSDFRSYYGSYLGTTTQNTNRGLWYSLANGTNSEVGLNGATAETGNAGTVGLELLSIGSAAGSFYAPINTQEIIIFASDQSSNRTGIETNINNYFSIYP